MNSSQLSQIKGAKRILEDCACFQGPPGPQGSTIVGPPGPVGPPGTISSFTVNGASTNALLYYDGTTISGMSSLFYYSTTNTLQANLDIIPCTDNKYELGSASYRWKDLYVGPSSIHLGTQAHIYEDVTGQVATNIGFRGSNMTTSTLTLGNGFGWQIQSVDGPNYDLLATRYIGSVFTGPTVSLLYPAGYISTAALTSTVRGLGTAGYISTSGLTSTVRGLGTAGYISSSQLISTAIGIDNDVHQDIMEVTTSTIVGLGSYGYISSLQLFSTVRGLGTASYISSSQLLSTVDGLGRIYPSTINFTSTVRGLGTAGYISSSQLTSTVTGLGTAGYISTQQLQSTTRGLGQIYLSSIPLVLANASFGKVLRVDSVYGNDTTALTNQYGYPFATIASAMGVASTFDMIYLLPGTYNEQVVFRSTISIRGASLNAVTIQKANVTADTTLVKMNRNTRLEDVTLNLTSISPLATKLIGVEISSCQQLSKLRTTVINVNNSGLTTNGTPINMYGVYSSGYSSTLQYASADDIERTTINVIGAGNGNKRCVYNDNSNRLQLRNCSLFCSDAMNATLTGGSFIGIETANVNSVVAIKTSSVCGSNYNGGNTSADVSQTAGQLDVYNSDIINRNANNLGLTIGSSQLLYSMGLASPLSNKPGQGGVVWSNSYLVPGTISFSGYAGTPISIYYPIRTPVVALLTTFSFEAATGAGYGTGATANISTFASLAVNGIIQPQFTLTLVGQQTTNYLSTSTIRLGANDNFGVYLSTSVADTAMTYPVINLSLY